MFGILESIVTVIETLFDLIINTFKGISTLFLSIPKYLVYVTSIVNILPAIVLPFVLLTISIMMVKFFVNR